MDPVDSVKSVPAYYHYKRKWIALTDLVPLPSSSLMAVFFGLAPANRLTCPGANGSPKGTWTCVVGPQFHGGLNPTKNGTHTECSNRA